MSRTSAWSGTYEPNKRPWVTVAPDAYVAIQGETTVIGCGECKREVNFNDYITSISTEANVDSAPGSATIQLTIPDNDVNNFYAENNFIIIPMMEVEIWAKGYYTVGGVPQYYRIFWGLVSAVQTSWSNGVTQISLSCKDILRWWEVTNVVLNPAFLNPFGTSAGGYQLFGNQFSGLNPYAVIIQLAKESMGDFSFNTGSFLSYTPESGKEKPFVSSYLGDVMLYWQAKFSKIWNSLILYGTSGQVYTTRTLGKTLSPVEFSKKIFENEWKYSVDEDPRSAGLKTEIANTAAYKVDFARAGDVDFFQTDSQDKLTVARTARDQIGFEFYCDTTGDIVFKPPFYNLNVLPNKPISWIQNFELMDDSMNDSEAEVYTHVTSSGHAFGGTTDWGLNDEITTPNTGVFDYHLLKRYGWRKLEWQSQWAGNAKKLFFHLMDMIDRINAKRHSGSFTIPLRPELRLGFPIYVEKYDSFFYINGISHSYSVGSSATTTVSVIAKRSKFLAPKNIGTIREAGTTLVPVSKVYGGTSAKDKKRTDGEVLVPVKSFKIEFPDRVGDTTGLAELTEPSEPVILRHPKTGKLLGYPNVVMVFRKTLSNQKLEELQKQDINQNAAGKIKTQKGINKKLDADQRNVQARIVDTLENGNRDQIIAKIRQHRYEAAATNAGVYDYAHDEKGFVKEFLIVPTDAVKYNNGDIDPNPLKLSEEQLKAQEAAEAATNQKIYEAYRALNLAKAELEITTADYNVQKALKGSNKASGQNVVLLDELTAKKAQLEENIKAQTEAINELNSVNLRKKLGTLSVMVRPVSDEFGFEVIGHYRYGRGVSIDLQRLNPTNSRDTNKLRIGFAPTGGFLTDATYTNAKSIQADTNAALRLEQMSAEDWQTGASFSGIDAKTNTNGINNVTLTEQNTYNGLFAGSGTRSKVFIEPDSLVSAKSLNELKPIISNDLISTAVESCSCGIGRPNWLSILPSDSIAAVLGNSTTVVPTTSNQSDFKNSLQNTPFISALRAGDTNNDAESSRIAGKQNQVILGSVSSANFFKVLNEYLYNAFTTSYAINSKRDKQYTQIGEAVSVSNSQTTTTGYANPYYNTYGVPSDMADVFAAASRGDPEAQKLLKSQINYNFGLTKKSLESFTIPDDTQREALLVKIKQETPSFRDLVNPDKVEAARGNRAPNPFDPLKLR